MSYTVLRSKIPLGVGLKGELMERFLKNLKKRGGMQQKPQGCTGKSWMQWRKLIPNHLG